MRSPWLILLPLLAAGCTEFDIDWRKDAALTTPPESLEGAWEGKWRSYHANVNSRFRCHFHAEGENRWLCRFQLVWNLDPIVYTVEVTAEPTVFTKGDPAGLKRGDVIQ